MDDEYVETSDIEELEEWNESLRFRRLRSLSLDESRAQLLPYKKIKLFHERDAGTTGLPSTPVKNVQGGRVPEIPALKPPFQTPTPSNSSATVGIDHVTSPTQTSESPLVAKAQPDDEDEHGPTVALYGSRDPFLLRSPARRRGICAETPLWSPPVAALPSPFLFSTTPPCAPTRARKQKRHVSIANTSFSSQPASSSLPPSAAPQSPVSVQAIDDDGDVLMGDRGPGIDSLFSSPVRGPNEEAIQSPYASSASPLHFPSSPLTRLGDESPSPSSPEPLRSESELSPIPGGLQNEYEEEVSGPAQEEVPEIPQEVPYTLRKRVPKQMRPYTADKIEYNAATRNHREARVIIRSPSRGHNRFPNESGGNEDGESQDLAFIAEEDESEVSEGGGRRKKRKRADDPLDEIQNTVEERERKRIRDQRRAEKAQREEDEELRRREREQRKKQRAEEQAVRRHTTIAGPSKNPPVAGPSSKRAPANRAEDIFDMYERMLDDDDDDMGDSPIVTPRRTPQPDAISISDDSDVQVPSRTQSPVPSDAHAPAPSRRRSTTPSHLGSPIPSTRSESSARSNRPAVDANAGQVHDVGLLFKMYPPGLARQLLKTGRFGSKLGKSRPTEPAIPENDGPLQPGQTRVTKRKGAEQKEIKGDSESELDVSDHDSASRSPSPPPSARRPSSYSPERSRPRRRRPTHRHTRKRIEYESDAGSAVESIDDDAIDGLTIWDNPVVRPKEEVTLIDYMLAGTRVLKSGSRGKKGKKKASRPRLDIVTAGARGDPRRTQALLSNFAGFGHNHETGARSNARNATPSSSRRPETDRENISSDEDDSDGSSESDDAQYRRAGGPRGATGHRKGKQAQQHRRDIYILKPAGGGKARIVSGAHKEMWTADVEEVAGIGSSRSGLKIRPWEGPGAYRRVRPPTHRPPLNPQKPHSERLASTTPGPLGPIERDSSPLGEGDDLTEETEAEGIRIVKDSGVPRLLSGIAFASGTYTKKGWLWELISGINPSQDWVPLAPVMLCASEYDIPVDATVDVAASVVDKALDRIFDFAYKLPAATPEPDAEQQTSMDNWTMISQNVCRGISFCMSKLSDDDRSKLVERVKGSVGILVNRLENWRMPRCRLDAPVLLASWIAVELSVRIGEPLTHGAGLASSLLTESIQLLVNQLLFFGLDSTMKSVVQGLEAESLSKSSVSVYTAELWARLIHVCGEYDKREVMKHSSTFWQFTIASFKGSLQEITPDAGYHEDLWHSVFSLCALSQFNAHGMVRDAVNLPECWELAHFLCDEAFKHTPEVDHSYVRYLLGRFFILNERWNWKVVNVSSLVKLIVDKVFHPIKFGNLKGEKPEFPEFLRNPDEDDLSKWARTDTAYVLLLKFVSKAAQEPSVRESTVKKLISLSEPAASINFDKERPLRRRDMGRIINRVTAAIFAVHLVNNEHYFANKVQQIRTTMPFSVANPQTKQTLIRGLDYWTQFIVRRQPTLGTHLLTPWLGDMAFHLSETWKKVQGERHTRPQLLVKMVLRVVQKAYEASPLEPEGDFLEVLRPLLRVTREDEAIQHDARMILVIGIDRWYRVHPPLRPPAPKEEVQEESQDLYGDAYGDIDWNGADIPEELGGPASSQDQDPKDPSRPTLKAAISDDLQWFLFRSFMHCFKNGDIDNGRTFMSTWVGCGLLTTGTVEEGIDQMSAVLAKNLAEDTPLSMRRAVDAAFVFALLQRHPMAYTTPHLADRFKLEYFLTCLVDGDASSFAFAAEYVSGILSVDYLQHPMLDGCQPLVSSSGNPPSYVLTVEEFLKIRVGMLETTISNLNALIERGHPDVAQFIDALAESFSAMRQTFITNAFASGEAKKEYAEFCLRILEEVQKSSSLAESPRMTFWVKTWRPLDKNAPVVDHDH